MWQSPDDLNNPWRPFRAGPIKTDQNRYSSDDDGAKLCRPKRTSSSGDENWNSVKVCSTGNGKYSKGQGRNDGRAYPGPHFRQGGVNESSLSDEIRGTGHDTRTGGNGSEQISTNDVVVQMNPSSQPGWQEGQSSEYSRYENGNQWSPFLHGFYDMSGNVEEGRYEYRQPDGDDSLYSERSSYSTDSDDVPEESYEIVERVEEDDNDGKAGGVVSKLTDHMNVEMYNTPPSSPCVKERYHTAPNSPRSDHDDFCIIDLQKDHEEFEDEASGLTVECVQNTFNKVNDNTNVVRCSSNTSITQVTRNEITSTNNPRINEHNLDTVLNAARPHEPSPLDTLTGTITACLEEAMASSQISDRDKQDIINFNRSTERFDRSRIPRMDLPPFIDVDCIQYEADPKTGAVRTVGKGSFGQVFKARFADPALRHLRIVVKEFNEDFTNRQEILDEAKRLLYLGDTGYVPICYGLVYLGDVDNPTYGLVQEYVGSGVTLEHVLWDQYDLEIHLWLSIAFQACEGLARFHEKGILLNDIKSNNIILEFFRTMIRIKYIDFGLATDMRGKRYKNSKSLEDFTYLAPEVRRDGCRTNIASDIFSLGFMLEQICSMAGVHELGFMTRLCMDMDPDSRLPVRAAANIIYEHMVAFRYDTSTLSR